LTHQFSRLSASEQAVIKFLASENIPVSIARSIESLSLSPADVGNAIVSLVRRGLVSRTETEDGTLFGVRSIVKKFTLQF
jgi:DNA-binding MarR family transcriptional regulator